MADREVRQFECLGAHVRYESPELSEEELDAVAPPSSKPSCLENVDEHIKLTKKKSWSLTIPEGRELFFKRREDAVRGLENILDLCVCMHSSEDWCLLHAAALSIRGQGFVFPGSSRAGKSTLTRAFLARGAELFSDDTAVLDKLGRLHSFPRDMSIRKGSLTRRARPEEFGSQFSQRSQKLNFVVLTHFDPQAKRAEFSPLSSSEGLVALMSHCPQSRQKPSDTMKFLGPLCEDITFLSGPRADSEEAVCALLERTGS